MTNLSFVQSQPSRVPPPPRTGRPAGSFASQPPVAIWLASDGPPPPMPQTPPLPERWLPASGEPANRLLSARGPPIDRYDDENLLKALLGGGGKSRAEKPFSSLTVLTEINGPFGPRFSSNPGVRYTMARGLFCSCVAGDAQSFHPGPVLPPRVSPSPPPSPPFPPPSPPSEALRALLQADNIPGKDNHPAAPSQPALPSGPKPIGPPFPFPQDLNLSAISESLIFLGSRGLRVLNIPEGGSTGTPASPPPRGRDSPHRHPSKALRPARRSPLPSGRCPPSGGTAPPPPSPLSSSTPPTSSPASQAPPRADLPTPPLPPDAKGGKRPMMGNQISPPFSGKDRFAKLKPPLSAGCVFV